MVDYRDGCNCTKMMSLPPREDCPVHGYNKCPKCGEPSWNEFGAMFVVRKGKIWCLECGLNYED